jgi:hypothetical protein
VPLAKAYPGRKRYFSIAFPIPDSDLLVDRLKTVVGLRPHFQPTYAWARGTRPVPTTPTMSARQSMNRYL